MINVIRSNSDNPDFIKLVKQLDVELAERDGNDHTFYAQYNKIDKIKYVAIAYENERPVGCGAIKEYSPDTMEVKRMYVPHEHRRKGIAAKILVELENWARELFYSKCILETGKRQPEAIGLYTKHNYKLIPNYGQYAEAENSVCFEKKILNKNISLNFTPFPNIETERLNLRQLFIEDDYQIFSIRSNESIAEFLGRPLCKSVEEARQFINKINNNIKNNENIYWAVTLKENPKLIGTICLWQFSFEESKAEIGFELLPEYQGKGIIQEAVKSVLDFGFNTINLSAIEGEVAPENIKSIKVMERFGFTKINEIRKNDSDEVKEGITVMYRLQL